LEEETWLDRENKQPAARNQQTYHIKLYHSCGGKKISFEILRSLFEFLNWMAL
jgi:hypothetical protein